MSCRGLAAGDSKRVCSLVLMRACRLMVYRGYLKAAKDMIGTSSLLVLPGSPAHEPNLPLSPLFQSEETHQLENGSCD